MTSKWCVSLAKSMHRGLVHKVAMGRRTFCYRKIDVFQTFLLFAHVFGNNPLDERNDETQLSWTWDENGYILYCPCMGRFGNQADHFLGALSFARALNRTLALPPWRTYKNVPFSEFFQIAPLQEYHRVIVMEDFMRHLAPKHWPVGHRKGYCWQPPNSNAKCIMKEGNPFKPFWDELGVDFDDYVVFHLGFHTDDPYTREEWQKQYPSSQHPVLAFRGAPASFPVLESNRHLHSYLKWSDKIEDEAQEFIDSTLSKGPFVGIHLRNGIDWKNACEHAEGLPDFMASPQCLGYSHYHKVTKEICFPLKEEIANHTQRVVLATGAKSVFVATDNDPMLTELEAVLGEVKVTHLNPWLPQVDLAILGKADHFIGNCISSFSAFVKRERDTNGKSSSFWSFSD